MSHRAACAAPDTCILMGIGSMSHAGDSARRRADSSRKALDEALLVKQILG